MNRGTIRAAATAVVSVALLAGGAAPASAGPTQTPNGWCGGANMRNAGAAMATAMAEHTHANGDAGMFRAVSNSACRS